MYEKEEWMLNIHENVTHIHASLAALLTVLGNKGVIDLDEFAELKKALLESPQYKTVLDDLQEQRAELEKLKNGDLGDIFASFFGGNSESKK